MLLHLQVFDARNTLRGNARMRLNYDTKEWKIEEDSQHIWPKVGFSSRGAFEEKAWTVTWLWDQPPGHQKRNTVILWGAPTSESDGAKAGSGRIYDPNDTAFKDGKVQWTAEPTPLSELRTNALKLLDTMLPAPYGSQKWLKNPFCSKKVSGGYTNCVEFPAYLIYALNLKKLLPGYPPTTTPGWTDADGKNKPRPGDIYILCKTPARDLSAAHVGVIYSTSWSNSNGLLWRTADWGQGPGGWDGAFVERKYDPQAASLTGDAASPYPGARAIRGWVDLDAYAAGSKKK